MKISKSKQELARIISENGGWRDGAESSAQCTGGEISFWYDTATKARGENWCGSYLGRSHDIQPFGYKLQSWHQTILSRDEYFHLYQVAEPAPEPEAKAMPTIEQLASDYRNLLDFAQRKQQEADDAKADADARLKSLELAGEAIGLVVTPIAARREPELVIADWRDLRVGDIVVITGSDNAGWKSFENQELDVRIDGDSCGDIYFGRWCMGDNTQWRFIRRP